VNLDITTNPKREGEYMRLKSEEKTHKDRISSSPMVLGIASFMTPNMTTTFRHSG
jgi:hypothetical protein